jgi:tripartite-type tricarboxylate transporter receptor subunit TctC
MHRRDFACAFVAALGVALWPNGASAQGYPNRIIRLVVPFAPGGSNDIVARLIAEKMTDALGQTVVVDNRASAGGVIGTDSVVKSVPDGYTLMIGATSTMAANPSLYTKMNLDPPKDLTPITQVASGPFVLAVPASLPVRTVKELIALAKNKPGEINFGSSGVGSSLQLTAELFKSMANISAEGRYDARPESHKNGRRSMATLYTIGGGSDFATITAALASGSVVPGDWLAFLSG